VQIQDQARQATQQVRVPDLMVQLTVLDLIQVAQEHPKLRAQVPYLELAQEASLLDLVLPVWRQFLLAVAGQMLASPDSVPGRQVAVVAAHPYLVALVVVLVESRYSPF
jgi:hypothetical protein